MPQPHLMFLSAELAAIIKVRRVRPHPAYEVASKNCQPPAPKFVEPDNLRQRPVSVARLVRSAPQT